MGSERLGTGADEEYTVFRMMNDAGNILRREPKIHRVQDSTHQGDVPVASR